MKQRGRGSALRTESARSRRWLQRTLAVLALLPVASATGEIVRGVDGVPGGSQVVPATVDSSLRYANVFKLAVGPVIWSQLARVPQSRALGFALSTIFVGGLARIRSWQQSGRPHPVAVFALVLETLGVPILLAWKARLSRTDRRAP